MNTIGIYGGVGGIAGAILGWCMGGLPGALAFTQLGAGAGTKLGTHQYTATSIKDVTDKVVKKTLEMADFAEKYLLAGGVVTIGYWTSTKTLEKRCSSPQKDFLCTSLDVTGLCLAVYCARSIAYMIKVATSYLKEKPDAEGLKDLGRKGAAQIQETQPSTSTERSQKSFQSSGSCASSSRSLGSLR